MLLLASWGSTTVSSDVAAGPSSVHDTAIVRSTNATDAWMASMAREVRSALVEAEQLGTDAELERTAAVSNARHDRQLSHGFLSSQACSSNTFGGVKTCSECCMYDSVWYLCAHGECGYTGCNTRSCGSCAPWPCTDDPPPSSPPTPPSSSPPPELPPPPLLKPAYECTLRACLVERLSEEQKATVKATFQASTALVSTVAATTVATTGVVAVVPLAFALQKSVILSNVGGSPAHPVLAGVGDQMQWLAGFRPGTTQFV